MNIDLSVLVEGWWPLAVRAAWIGCVLLPAAWLLTRPWLRLPVAARAWVWRLALIKWLLVCFAMPALRLPLLPAPQPVVAPALQDSLPPAAPAALPADNSAPRTASRPSSRTAADQQIDPRLWLFGLWVLGVQWGGLRLARQWGEARQLRRAAVAAPEVGAPGAEPAVLVAEGVAAPLLLGVCRPVVILPRVVVDRCSRDELRLILAHEMAHHERHDILWNWLAVAASLLLFWHPLLGPALRELRLAEEQACDELVLEQTGSRSAPYAELLLKLATARPPRHHRPLTSAAVVESGWALERRLRALDRRSRRSRAGRWLIRALPSAGLLAILPWSVVAAPVELGEPELLVNAVLDSDGHRLPNPLHGYYLGGGGQGIVLDVPEAVGGSQPHRIEVGLSPACWSLGDVDPTALDAGRWMLIGALPGDRKKGEPLAADAVLFWPPGNDRRMSLPELAAVLPKRQDGRLRQYVMATLVGAENGRIRCESGGPGMTAGFEPGEALAVTLDPEAMVVAAGVTDRSALVPGLPTQVGLDTRTLRFKVLQTPAEWELAPDGLDNPMWQPLSAQGILVAKEADGVVLESEWRHRRLKLPLTPDLRCRRTVLVGLDELLVGDFIETGGLLSDDGSALDGRFALGFRGPDSPGPRAVQEAVNWLQAPGFYGMSRPTRRLPGDELLLGTVVAVTPLRLRRAGIYTAGIAALPNDELELRLPADTKVAMLVRSTPEELVLDRPACYIEWAPQQEDGTRQRLPMLFQPAPAEPALDVAAAPVRTADSGQPLGPGADTFPWGVIVYTPRPGDMKLVHEAGLNTALVNFNGWPVGLVRKQLDEAQASGVKLVINLGKYYDGERVGRDDLGQYPTVEAMVEALVTACRDHPALLGYQIGWMHAPEEHPDIFAKLSRLVARLDPEHLTTVTLSPAGLDKIDIAAASADRIGLLDAPVPGRSLTGLGLGCRQISDALVPPQAAYAEVQAFDRRAWHPDGPGERGPTLAELRTMVYGALCGGAKGVMFYSLYSIRSIPETSKVLWAQVRTIGREVAPLLPFLASDVTPPDLHLQSPVPGGMARAWSMGDGILVLACNGGEQETTILWAPPAGATIEKLAGEAGQIDDAGISLDVGQAVAVKLTLP